ncbi:hypothetical protein ACU639_22905 [Streptomyces cynarae]
MIVKDGFDGSRTEAIELARVGRGGSADYLLFIDAEDVTRRIRGVRVLGR